MKNFAARLLLAFLFLAPLPALAQNGGRVVADCTTGVPLAYGLGSTSIPTILPTGSACVVASVSASITGFPTVQSTGTPIAVTTGGVTGTLPTGAVVVASNVGTTNNAYCKLGASATVNDQLIAPNSWFAFTVGANTQLTCITSTSTTTVNLVGGSGLPTGAGGGGGGSGGGTVVQGNAGTNAQAWWTRIGDATGGPAVVKAGNTFAGTEVALGVAVTNTLPPGQAAMAASSPVVIASNQTAIPSSIDPCNDALTVKSFLPITATTSLVKVIATGTAAKKLYICQIILTTTAANNVAVFEATTATTCATSAVAVYGAGTSVATAANGFPFPANGGVSLGNGLGTVGFTTVNNNDLCIGTSAATPLTGGITYATK